MKHSDGRGFSLLPSGFPLTAQRILARNSLTLEATCSVAGITAQGAPTEEEVPRVPQPPMRAELCAVQFYSQGRL